jgi:hypothetical protein
VLVQGVLERLRELGAGSVRELHGEPEDMVFALPKELRLLPAVWHRLERPFKALSVHERQQSCTTLCQYRWRP